MLAQVLSLLESGHGVQIIPKDAELTTQQAADVLNVSRPYIIGLLESRADPVPQGRPTSTDHFRSAHGVQAARRLAQRRAAADDLADLSQELGLY